MYISVRNAPAPVQRTGARVPGTVLVLGFVSLLTDISTEMVAAVLPLFVTVGLGLSPLAFGVLDSIYQAGSGVSRVGGGYVADRLQRPKGVATVGYGLGAVAKLLLIPATALGAVATAVAVDRFGKGIRTGPRDALIASSSPPEALGRSFGVHRALDTTGAMLGPVAAFYLLVAAPGDFDLVFTVGACFAGLGLVLLIAGVERDRHAGQPALPRDPSSKARQLLLSSKAFRRLLLTAVLLSSLTISDAFIYLTLLERDLVTAQLFPLLFLATSLVYLAAAVPVGRVADRLDRTKVFLAGHVLVVCAYLLVSTADGLPTALAALALLGLYYAATDGVLPAAASPLVPAEWLSTAISTLQTGVALGRSVAAFTFGALWAFGGLQPALWLFGVALLAASPLVPAEWLSTAISTLQTGVALGRSVAALTFGALWAFGGLQPALWLFGVALLAATALVTLVLNRSKTEVARS